MGVKAKIKDRLYNNIYPFSYNGAKERFYSGIIRNTKEPMRRMMDKIIDNPSIVNTDIHNRMDAFATYLEKPQKYNSLSQSKFSPSITKNNKNKFYYSINHLDKDKFIQNVDTVSQSKSKKLVLEDDSMTMGQYTASIGEDQRGKYLSYYDRWDINPLSLKNPITKKEINTDIGKPFELYDRVYYDAYSPDNYKPRVIKPRHAGNFIKNSKNFIPSFKTKLYNNGGSIRFASPIKNDFKTQLSYGLQK